MREAAKAYYAELRKEYPARIRQLVPKYDQMVQCIVELLQLGAPRTVLDIGAGIGNLTAILAGSLPEARITALEASDEMFQEARLHLGSASDRIRLVHGDILEFRPAENYDAIFSNLVLHNIDRVRKRGLLASLADWLAPGGVFVWGDLIRHNDQEVQNRAVQFRQTFARAAGCPPDLVRRNFEKENSLDHPLTVEETLSQATDAGFQHADLVWAHDTFAIFFMRKAAPRDH